MENPDEISILFQTKNLLHIENIDVICSSEFNQKKYDGFDDLINKKWEEILKENPRFYNASKFRLDNILWRNGHLTINLGFTDYKSTLCSNHSPELIDELRQKGVTDYGDKNSYLSHSLGVGSIVVTSDNYIVLMKRADWVAEAKGLVDTPGGHAEPQEVLSKYCGESSKNTDIFSLDSSAIRYELFHSMVREIRDELNVPEESIDFPSLLGIVRNETLGGKPGLVFCLSLTLPKHEVERFYGMGGLETDESTCLIFMHVEDLMKKSPDTMNVISNMAPCGKAAMKFYYDYKLTESQ